MVDRRVPVTREQVRAAGLEVAALRRAGLTPDPMVERLASVTSTRTTSWNVAEAPKDHTQRGVSKGAKEVTGFDKALESAVKEPGSPRVTEPPTPSKRRSLEDLERSSANTEDTVDRAVRAVDEALESEIAEDVSGSERGQASRGRREPELDRDDSRGIDI